MQGRQVFVEALGYRTALLLSPEGGIVCGGILPTSIITNFLQPAGHF